MRPLFALRHKITGHYLPEPKGRMGRGGSHTEPVDCSGDLPNPRLFKSELSAKRALTAWLQGKHYGNYSWESDDTWGNSYRVQDGVSVEPVPERRKDDWEIVSFQLILEDQNVPSIHKERLPTG